METSFGIFVVIICLNLKEHTYSYHHTCKLKISTIRNEELNLCLLLDQRGQGLKGRRGGLRATLRETGQPAWQGAGCSRANHTSCFLYSCDSDIWEVLLMGRDRPPPGLVHSSRQQATSWGAGPLHTRHAPQPAPYQTQTQSQYFSCLKSSQGQVLCPVQPFPQKPWQRPAQDLPSLQAQSWCLGMGSRVARPHHLGTRK